MCVCWSVQPSVAHVGALYFYGIVLNFNNKLLNTEQTFFFLQWICSVWKLSWGAILPSTLSICGSTVNTVDLWKEPEKIRWFIFQPGTSINYESFNKVLLLAVKLFPGSLFKVDYVFRNVDYNGTCGFDSF